ncbi:OmpA family protein [Microbulbifer sp. GL-2]|uniref:OmpA family protein n=1 Tax=Microbulbifer sp. GL-2 TaxID=2591606 RepID=UPI001165BB5F|nr:OmpA family protein [Microbulbifer sp. GL-2]BBM01652.1 hypothetical protein GL2_17260 [Microbulbifer sp. GL-2]
MSENLLALAASQLGTSGIGALASVLDIPAEQGQKALDTGLAYSLAGMLNKASSKTGMGYLFNMVTDNEALDLSTVTESFSDKDKLDSILQSGAGMLQKVFGTRVEEVIKLASTALSGGDGSRLLKLALPIITSLLSGQVKAQKMDVSDLASLLIGQREFLQDKIPDDLLKALNVPGFDQLGASLVTHGHAKPQEPRPEALHGNGEKRKPVSFSSWFFPLLLVLVALYALNMCMDKGREEAPENRPSLTTQEQAFMESPSEPVGDLTDGNAQAKLGPDDFASNLRDYLKSFARQPDREFPLRINFEGSSAKILNPSAPDIVALAKIMQEHPNLSIAIEGHVKGEGNEIEEQEVSQERADAVREILLQKGIAANRITATGMGSAKEVPEGEAEKKEQRQMDNERISVRVVNFQ